MPDFLTPSTESAGAKPESVQQADWELQQANNLAEHQAAEASGLQSGLPIDDVGLQKGAE